MLTPACGELFVSVVGICLEMWEVSMLGCVVAAQLQAMLPSGYAAPWSELKDVGVDLTGSACTCVMLCDCTVVTFDGEFI